MKSAHHKGITNLQVYGDSEITIRWMKSEIQILRPGLLYLAGLVKNAAALFRHITFEHIYRQFNVRVDRLSKDSLAGAPLQLHEDERRNGTVVSDSHLKHGCNNHNTQVF